jgi:hypothetical protein
MALVKRGKTWHTHFFVDGQRYRQSLETSDWREAQANEKELIARASQGKLAPASQQFSKLNVSDAFERYLADRAAHVQPRSGRSESDHAKPSETTLVPFRLPVSTRTRFWHTFGTARLRDCRTRPLTWSSGYCDAF